MSDIDPRCAAFEDDLSALLDGELDGARADAVRTHAETCAACSRRLVALRAVDAELAEVAAAPSSSEAVRLAALHVRLADRGRAAATGAHRASPRRRRWVLPAAAGALAAAAAALFAVLQPAPQPIPAEQGVAIVADTSEPARVQPAPFAKQGLDAGEFAGHGASAPAEDMPAHEAAPAETIDAADVEVVALLDVLDPEPRELRGSLARDERNRARWQSLRPEAREALRAQWRVFQTLTVDEQGAMLRGRDAAP